MWQAFPTPDYYAPSDFLTAVSTPSLFRLVGRYSRPWESGQDLPRLPYGFDCMPRSPTPEESPAPAL